LLDSGADINMEDKKFTTPLSVAKKSSKPQVINLLLARGAKNGPSIQG
jgi:ankyrin repeat protein